MFFFESIPWYSALMFFAVLFGLMFISELARRSMWFSIVLFIIVPVILPFTLWRYTATGDSSVGSWFHWAKTYSALAGCVGFMVLRYVKKWQSNKYLLAFPAIILAVNILEAVIRDFQIYTMDVNGMVDGMMVVSGPWNLMNGIAGILNIITISGFMGIVISKDKFKDMVWPDQLWFWIIAYDVWNFAYVYNCVGDHAFYAGMALLLSCTLPAFFIKKGAWLQYRAQTLGIWMIFVMSFPTFVDTSKFAVKSSHNTTALMIVSVLSIVINIAVFVYHFATIKKLKRKPIKGEVYTDLEAYNDILVDSGYTKKA